MYHANDFVVVRVVSFLGASVLAASISEAFPPGRRVKTRPSLAMVRKQPDQPDPPTTSKVSKAHYRIELIFLSLA